MVALKHRDVRAIVAAFAMESGYVLDFSDKTFAEWFDDEFSVNIYQEKYAFNGSSKAKHLRAFTSVESSHLVGQMLRRMWKRREALPSLATQDGHEEKGKSLFKVIHRIENDAEVSTDVVEIFKKDLTLVELVSSIQRDIAAEKHAPALDRLHTYCMKKFGHLLDEYDVTWEKSEPIHSRVGKYLKALERDRPLRDLSRQIIRNAIGIAEKFNHVRNNDTLAHDNQLPDKHEAQFMFESVVSILRFIKGVEASRFGT